MSRHRRAPRRARAAVTSVLGVALAAALALVLQVPGARGAFLAGVTNPGDSAASNAYFTCAAAAQGETTTRATFAYPLSDTNLLGLLPTTDVSGNNNTGNYSTLGVTTGVANGGVCPRDGRTVITLDGASGAVYGPSTASPAPGPNTFTEEIWFRTSSAQGKLLGFGNLRTGASTSNDRHLYVDSTGSLVFGVYQNSTVRTLSSSTRVTDGAWHYAAATLSSAGMALYLDGQRVGLDPATTTGENHAGYWRIGYDTISPGWPNIPSSAYFKGSLAFASVYPVALSAAQIAQHYAAGR